MIIVCHSCVPLILQTIIFYLKPREKNLFLNISSYLCILRTSSVFFFYGADMVLTSQGQQSELMNNNNSFSVRFLPMSLVKLRKNKLSSSSSVCNLLSVISEMFETKNPNDCKHFKFMT